MAATMKTPVTVLTGFLGAGKTTLLNRILSEQHGRKYAVIENEFGDVGVDNALIKLQSQEAVIEMMNGCICCTVRGDLVKTLNELMERRTNFDGIIIETTGLADPAPVAQTFFMDEGLRSKLYLDAIVTVVDAKHVIQHLDDVKPEGVENEAVEQLAFADVVILNKIDLVDDKQKADVTKRIKAINGAVEIIEATHAKVEVDRLVGIRAFSLDRVLDMEPTFLDELMTERGADIFRSKGVLSLAGSDSKYVFQAVHMLCMMGTVGGNDSWRPDEARTNRLVFIGRHLDSEQLNASFRDCLVDPGLIAAASA